MTAFASWVGDNWFNIAQTAGIIGSLSMAAAASNREARAKETENLLTLSEHHRNLWAVITQRPELERIFQTNMDVLKSPATPVEDVFLNEAIVQFLTGWRIATAGGITTVRELAADVRGFFSLPLPRAVWERTKEFRNQRFVSFVEKALKPER